jgi:hypothetical protein
LLRGRGLGTVACARMPRMMLSTWLSLMRCTRAQDVGQGGHGPEVKGGEAGGGETSAAAAVAECIDGNKGLREGGGCCSD